MLYTCVCCFSLSTYVDNQQILRVAPPGGGFHELGHTSNIWAGGQRMAPFDREVGPSLCSSVASGLW